MEGILRIGSVQVDTTKNKGVYIPEFVDNIEFRSESEIEDFVNSKLGINFAHVIE